MALIKKYNTGGSFKDYVNERLLKGDLPLTNKSYSYVQDALQKFDPNTVSSDQPVGELKKTWAGQFNLDSTNTNAYLANLYQDFQKAAPSEVSITPEGGWGPVDRSIGTLIDYVSKTNYNDNQDYAIQQIAKMTDNNQVKKYVVQNAKNLLNDYITKSGENPSDNWQNIDEIRNIQNIVSGIDTNKDISDEDWEKVSSFTDKLGWQLNDFLIPDKVFTERKKQEEAKKVEGEKTDIYNSLKDLDISDENMQNELYQYGYTNPADKLNTNIKNYLTQKGYNVLANKAGNDYMVLKGNELVTEGAGLLTQDPFSEDYGKSFSVQNGKLVFYDKGQLPEGFTPTFAKDEGSKGKEIKIEDPRFKDFTVTGFARDVYTGDTYKDVLGRADYTKKLIFTSRTTGGKFAVYKGEDGKYYKQDGTEFKVPKLSGFTGVDVNIPRDINQEYFELEGSPVYGVKAKNNNLTMPQMESEILNIENSIKRGKYEHNKKSYSKLLENLSYFLENSDPNNPERMKKIDQLMIRLQKIRTTKTNPMDPNSPSVIAMNKQGGVLKAQNGTSFASLSKQLSGKSDAEQKTSSEPNKIIKVTDVTNAWKNASGWQRASAIASGLSFVPAIGVVGGAASTVFDAIEGSEDGWQTEDTINLLTNVGFTALSLVGLGSTKAVKLLGKAVKAGNVVGKVDDVAQLKKTIKLADKAIKQGEKLSGKGFITAKSEKNLEAARKVADILDKEKSLSKITPEDLNKLSELANIKTKWLPAKTEGLVEGVKATGKFLAEKAPVVGNTLKYGAMAGTGISGVSGGIELGKNIKEEGLVEGFKNTDINSIRNILQLGAISHAGIRNRKFSKAFEKNVVETKGTPARTIVTLGDKQINVEGNLGKLGITNKSKREFLNKLSNNESVKKEDKNLIEEFLKKDKLGKVRSDFIKKSSEAVELIERPLSDSYKDIEDWKRTKRMIEKGWSSYSSPYRLRGKKYKAVLNKPTEKHQLGGILKLQQSGIIPSLYTLSNNSLKLPKFETNIGYQNPLSTTPKYTLLNQYADIKKYPFVNGIISGKPIQRSTGASTGTTSDGMIKAYQIQPFTPEKYKNWSFLTETGKLLTSRIGNRRATDLTAQAVAQVPLLTTASRTYLPTNMGTSNLAFKQAEEATRAARGIGRSTSDIDKSIAAQLEGTKQASNIQLAGITEDIRKNEAIRGQQLESDARVNELNRNIMNQQAQMGAESRSKLYQIYANLAAMNNTGTQNYLSTLGRELNLKPVREMYWNFQQESMNPNITGLQKHEAYLATTGKDIYKKAYEDYWAGIDPTYATKPKWEKSEQYEAWQNRLKGNRESLATIMAKYNTLGRAAQASMPMIQKGGRIPLSEKIALENVKYNHKKALKNEELFYKQLMENNKLVQKALIKVFK